MDPGYARLMNSLHMLKCDVGFLTDMVRNIEKFGEHFALGVSRIHV